MPIEKKLVYKKKFIEISIESINILNIESIKMTNSKLIQKWSSKILLICLLPLQPLQPHFEYNAHSVQATTVIV